MLHSPTAHTRSLPKHARSLQLDTIPPPPLGVGGERVIERDSSVASGAGVVSMSKTNRGAGRATLRSCNTPSTFVAYLHLFCQMLLAKSLRGVVPIWNPVTIFREERPSAQSPIVRMPIDSSLWRLPRDHISKSTSHLRTLRSRGK